MKTVPLSRVLAKNLRFFMEREGAPYTNANTLSKAAGVSAGTVRNLLDPAKRTVTAGKPNGAPTLDKLQAIADALGAQVWELLHPDLERSIRERDMYRKIEATYSTLPPSKAPEGRSPPDPSTKSRSTA